MAIWNIIRIALVVFVVAYLVYDWRVGRAAAEDPGATVLIEAGVFDKNSSLYLDCVGNALEIIREENPGANDWIQEGA